MKRREFPPPVEHLVEHDSPGILLVPSPEPDPSDLPRSQCLGHPFVVEPALTVNAFMGDRTVPMDNRAGALHLYKGIGVIVGVIDGTRSGKELFVCSMPDRGGEGCECQIKTLIGDPERKDKSRGSVVFMVKTISSDADRKGAILRGHRAPEPPPLPFGRDKCFPVQVRDRPVKPEDLPGCPRPPGRLLGRGLLVVFHPKEGRLKSQVSSFLRLQKSCHVPPLDGEVLMGQKVVPKCRGGGGMNVGSECPPRKDHEKYRQEGVACWFHKRSPAMVLSRFSK